MDFSYGNKVINASGPIKPSDRNMPGDPRTRVEVFADIANIPTPYVGMTITVLQDETNDNKMTEYKVKSLKANSFGVANSLVDEVVRYVDYLGATSGGGSSSGGASVEIVNDLTTGGANKALSAEQGKVIKSSLDNITREMGGAVFLGDSVGEVVADPDVTNPSQNYFVKEYSNNICNQELEYDGKYYDYKTGTLVTLNGYCSTKLIPVKENTFYTKTFSSHVTFWNENKEFISGQNAGSFTTPTGTKYIRTSLPNAMKNRIVIIESDRILNIKRLPYLKKYELDYSKIRTNEIKHNAEIPLFIETYDGTNQPTHPKLLYFKNGFNGYKYWLSYTPYPNGQPATENPCIAVSNDLLNWTIPVGLTNPIGKAPSNAGMSNYNSDAHLVYNGTALECWYREVTNANTETIKRITSTDGVNWSPSEVLAVESSSNVLKLISPCVIYKDNKYKIWVMTENIVNAYESTDGTNWISLGACVDSNDDAIVTWHFDIIETNEGYEMLNYIGRSENGTLTHFKSVDGLKWVQTDFLMKPSENETAFDSRSLYRSTFIKENGKYSLIYGSSSKSGKWRMSLSQSINDDINTLIGIKKYHSVYFNKPTQKDPFAENGDFFYDATSNKILYRVYKNDTLVWIDANGTNC